MPFQSEKQRRFLHANHPEIAKRWERDYANGGISNHFKLKDGGRTNYIYGGISHPDGRRGFPGGAGTPGGYQADWGGPSFDNIGGEGGPPSILNPPPKGPTATEIAAAKAAAAAEKKAVAQAEYKNWWDATKTKKKEKVKHTQKIKDWVTEHPVETVASSLVPLGALKAKEYVGDIKKINQWAKMGFGKGNPVPMKMIETLKGSWVPNKIFEKLGHGAGSTKDWFFSRTSPKHFGPVETVVKGLKSPLVKGITKTIPALGTAYTVADLLAQRSEAMGTEADRISTLEGDDQTEAIEEYATKMYKPYAHGGIANHFRKRVGFADVNVQTLNALFPERNPESTDFQPLDIPGAILPPLAIGAGAKYLKDKFFSKPEDESKEDIVESDRKEPDQEPPEDPDFIPEVLELFNRDEDEGMKYNEKLGRKIMDMEHYTNKMPENYEGPTVETVTSGYDAHPFTKKDFDGGALDNKTIKKAFLSVAGDEGETEVEIQPFNRDKFLLTPERGQKEIALRLIKQKLSEDKADPKIITHITNIQKILNDEIKKLGYLGAGAELEENLSVGFGLFDQLKRQKHANGGILDINASEEIISDDGNDIELTAYNAAFDDPNDLSTGVRTLFMKKGGNVRLGPHTATDLLAKKNPDGTRSKYQPPGHKDAPAHHGDVAHGPGGRFDQPSAPVQTQTVTTPKDGPTILRGGGPDFATIPDIEGEYNKELKARYDEEQKKTKDLNRRRQLARLANEYEEKWGKYDDPTEQWGHHNVYGINQYKEIKQTRYETQKEELEKKIKNSLIKKGIFVLSGGTLGIKDLMGGAIDWKNKKIDITGILGDMWDLDKLKKDYLADLEDIKQSYRNIGIPEHNPHVDTPIQTINQEILDRTKKRDKDDAPETQFVPPVVPAGEEIEESEGMYVMSPWERIKANQARRALLVEKGIIQDNPIVDESVTDITMQANSGGLANLFRVKNQ